VRVYGESKQTGGEWAWRSSVTAWGGWTDLSLRARVLSRRRTRPVRVIQPKTSRFFVAGQVEMVNVLDTIL
jgi:hypothetical protein